MVDIWYGRRLLELTAEQFNDLSDIDKHYYVFNFASERGVVYNKRKLVSGIGKNDADYVTKPTIGGIKVACPAYLSWKSMLMRVGSKSFQTGRPWYIGVSVCDEWREFSNYLSWWKINQVDGWELDKDLLTDDREYHPDKCLFVPAWLNTFTNSHKSARGQYLIGVSYIKREKAFQAFCNNKYVGRFSSEEAAHQAWRRSKLESAKELRPKMDEIDSRIYPRVVEIIERSY